MSRNPTGASGAAPLDEDLRRQLVALAASDAAAFREVSADLSEASLARALAGLPVRPATRALIRLGLERLAASSSDPIAQALEGVLDEMTSKAQPKPVCPRCLDLIPGTPGGTPETPHPGPFTEELCAACSRAVERDLRKEGRSQAAGFETKPAQGRPARERLVTAMMSADGRPREEAERLADRWIEGKAIHGSWLPEFAEPVRLAREEAKL